MRYAVILLIVAVSAFSDKYMKKVDEETQRLTRIKKGPLVRLLRDLEPLIWRYETIFNQTVIEVPTEEDRKAGLDQYLADFPRKYAFDFDRYLIAQDICFARFPEDPVCESETKQIDWNYWHDFRQEGDKKAHIEKLKSGIKEYLKKFKKIEL